MTTKAKLNPKEVRDDKFEKKAQLKAVEEKIYQTMEVSTLLTELTMRNERVMEIKDKLKDAETLLKSETNGYVVASRKLQEDLDNKIAENENLGLEMLRTRKEYEDKLVKLAASKDEEISNLKSEGYNKQFELNKKISEMNEELRSLKDFKERQEEYYSQLDYWKKRCDELIHKHNDDLKRIDNETKKAIQMQDEKYKKDVSQIKHDSKKEAEQEVEILERKVIEDNKKLHADLLEYKREVEALKKEKERAIGESKQVRQNVSLQEDSAIEYQAIHFRQENKIRKLKEKVQVLKNYIAQEVNKHTKEMEASNYQYQVRVSELEVQNQAMREELRIKMKESKNLKALSQIILDQRSEIEEFLLETLDHVKEEVRRQRNSDRKTTRLPEIGSKSKLDAKPKKNWERIDFSALDWEDKEKILRILFSKMNNGILPANWRSTMLEKSTDLSNNSQSGGLGPQYYTVESSQKSPVKA